MIAGSFIDICLVVAFLMPMRSNVASIVSEKELRLREGMRLLGVTDLAYWTSWVLTHLTQLLLMSAGMSTFATITFPESNAFVTFLFFALMSMSLIPLAYLLSCFFYRTSTAGPAAVLIFVVLMIPGMVAPVMEPYGGVSFKLSSFLAPSCVAMFGFVIRHLEFSGLGLNWSTLGKHITLDGSLTAGGLLTSLCLDAFLCTLLFFYLDKVLPDESGRKLPVYFIFKRDYWAQVLGLSREGGRGRGWRGKGRRESADHIGSKNTKLRIHNLTKDFNSITGAKVRAVDHLCLEADTSEVFGLLGHNGAGKTTTMSIITGMLYPTSGNVYVGQHSVLHNMDQIRKSLGLCPQFDILWPTLTVQDHLRFYAEIKGIPTHDRERVVVRMAAEVGLLDKMTCPSCELSGGQRRKLSVGIAFMGDPFLVVLDEPTSGMDPKSRRDTWDIIRKNRAERVIMLSTHFMDEADILCDRIGIMHTGKLATCGSSLELKERHGAGYVLTLIVDDDDNNNNNNNISNRQANKHTSKQTNTQTRNAISKQSHKQTHRQT